MRRLEALFSARSGADQLRVASDRRHAYEWLPIEDDDLRRDLRIQAALADRGQLRALSVPDLIIAAVAERHRVCLLHYHGLHYYGTYEHVANITGQATRRVVPEGSIA